MSIPLPPNVHLSTHPCLAAKLSQLRSAQTTSSRHVRSLIHEITTILAVEALASILSTTSGPSAPSALSASSVYQTAQITPSRLALIPILRSGLSMLDAVQALLPHEQGVPVHHLGLFREPTGLQPVEYYNNLPYHSSQKVEGASGEEQLPEVALLLDPIIATGGTSVAAVQTLREWGAGRIVVLAVLASDEGLRKVAAELEATSQGTTGKVDVWVAGVDSALNEKGMIVPGLGDVGDRLFLTIGK